MSELRKSPRLSAKLRKDTGIVPVKHDAKKVREIAPVKREAKKAGFLSGLRTRRSFLAQLESPWTPDTPCKECIGFARTKGMFTTQKLSCRW